MTQIVVDRPPNFAAIVAVIPMAAKPGIIFAWGDRMYNPDNVRVPAWLVAHEEVHFSQQAAVGGPEIWWERYLANPTFRFEQELEAHRVEWEAWKAAEVRRRVDRRWYANLLADRLSGPVYNCGLTRAKVKEAILA